MELRQKVTEAWQKVLNFATEVCGTCPSWWTQCWFKVTGWAGFATLTATTPTSTRTCPSVSVPEIRSAGLSYRCVLSASVSTLLDCQSVVWRLRALWCCLLTTTVHMATSAGFTYYWSLLYSAVLCCWTDCVYRVTPRPVLLQNTFA